jgi:hypothetical protein
MCITIRHLLRIGLHVHYNDGDAIQTAFCVLHFQICCTTIIMCITSYLMLCRNLSVYYTFPVAIQQDHLGICFAEDIMCITIRHLLRIGFNVYHNDGNAIRITSCVLHSQHCCTTIIMFITSWFMLYRNFYVYYTVPIAI